jgi:hypothetical protein
MTSADESRVDRECLEGIEKRQLIKRTETTAQQKSPIVRAIARDEGPPWLS